MTTPADRTTAVDEEKRQLREQNESYRLQLNEMSSENEQLRARVRELERPAIEAKRNEIRQSYAELIATCEETKDYEGAFDVRCRLRDREEQWAREDAAV